MVVPERQPFGIYTGCEYEGAPSFGDNWKDSITTENMAIYYDYIGADRT